LCRGGALNSSLLPGLLFKETTTGLKTMSRVAMLWMFLFLVVMLWQPQLSVGIKARLCWLLFKRSAVVAVSGADAADNFLLDGCASTPPANDILLILAISDDLSLHFSFLFNLLISTNPDTAHYPEINTN
jgi:hypothetical protein